MPSRSSSSRFTTRTSERSSHSCKSTSRSKIERNLTPAQKKVSSTGMHAVFNTTKPVKMLSRSADPTEAVRNCVRKNGGNGLRGINRVFTKWTCLGQPKLFFGDFRTGLHDHGCMLQDADIKKVISMWGNGDYMTFDDFLVGMRGSLNTARRVPVDRVFNKLDIDGNGVVSLEEFKTRFKVDKRNQELKKGKTEDEIVREFMKSFEGKHGNGDGNITREEFEEYYRAVASNFDSDRQFVFMMERAWQTARKTARSRSSSRTTRKERPRTSKDSDRSRGRSSTRRSSSSSAKRRPRRSSSRSRTSSRC